MKHIDLNKIDNIEFDGIDTKDYPDFSDAYILNADYEGREMTEDEINWLNDNHFDFFYETLLNKIF